MRLRIRKSGHRRLVGSRQRPVSRVRSLRPDHHSGTGSSEELKEGFGRSGLDCVGCERCRKSDATRNSAGVTNNPMCREVAEYLAGLEEGHHSLPTR